MLFMALGAITCLVTLTRARLDSKAVLPNSPSHTYTHHRNSHTQAIRAHLSTFKHAHIHYTLPMHCQWMLFIVGIYLPACSSVCVYSCERRWACSPHRPALRSGDFVSNTPPPPAITKSNAMLHCAISYGKSQGGIPDSSQGCPSTPCCQWWKSTWFHLLPFSLVQTQQNKGREMSSVTTSLLHKQWLVGNIVQACQWQIILIHSSVSHRLWRGPWGHFFHQRVSFVNSRWAACDGDLL